MVTILGEPNAGKSTLLNALVGQKVAIVTPKPQTTRTRVLGIAEFPVKGKRPAAQIVLLDTPGVLAPATALDRRMLGEIYEALAAHDAVLLMVDATKAPPWKRANADSSGRPGDPRNDNKKAATQKGSGAREAQMLKILGELEGPVFLVLNKIDLVDKRNLLPLIAAWSERYKFAEVLPISALKKRGLDELTDALIAAMPMGERYFPEDEVTDQPLRFLVAELIRERILMETGQEIPYSSAVVVERFQEPTEADAKRAAKSGRPPLTRIAAAIFCERDSQKAILIGKQGSMLKKIGSSARAQIEDLLGTRVMLELFVKVEKGWRDSGRFIDELDWRKQLEDLSSRDT